MLYLKRNENMMNPDLLMIILTIMMTTRKRRKRIILLKKVVIGHKVIDSVKLRRQRHGNVVVNLPLVPDPGIERTTMSKLLRGLALVVLVPDFLSKLLFQKAVLVWRDRKLHPGLGGLVLILASNLQV